MFCVTFESVNSDDSCRMWLVLCSSTRFTAMYFERSDRNHWKSSSFGRSFVCLFVAIPFVLLRSERLWIRVKVHYSACAHCSIHSLLYSLLSRRYFVSCYDMPACLCMQYWKLSIHSHSPISVNPIKSEPIVVPTSQNFIERNILVSLAFKDTFPWKINAKECHY